MTQTIRNIVIVLFVFLGTHTVTKWISNRYNLAKIENTRPVNFYENQVHMIFIGSSNCPSAKDPRLQQMLRDISNSYRDQSNSRGYGFSYSGISIENDIDKGIRYLRGYGGFDEISVGNSLENIALQQYIWQNWNHPHSAGTPQVIVTKRTFKMQSNPSGSFAPSPMVENETFWIRRVGISEIETLLSDVIIP